MTNKKFRISAKKIFLTYSQVPSDFTHQHVLQQLQTKINKKFNYIIAKELHQDQNTHYHVILISNDKFNIFKQNTLDVIFHDQILHGNYSPVKNLNQAVNYICKNNDYITDLENLINGQLLTTKQFIIKQVKDKGLEKALLDHYDKLPNQAIAGISVSSLLKQFKDIAKLKTNLILNDTQTPFTLDNFKVSNLLKQWMQKPNKTLVLVGASGIGKTQFCKTYVNQKKLKTLFVTHKEDFKRLDDSYQAIIVDDANVEQFNDNQLFNLVDLETERTIRILYDTVIKKPNLIQMIAMNLEQFRTIRYLLQQDRFCRRILYQELSKPFIINFTINNNININNNYYNKNYDNNNSPIDVKQHQQNEQAFIKSNRDRIKATSDKHYFF